ncbi:MAG: biopolymer transporter ExbD [Deltaproteobacteria bacterium]|nr:MAG: biopolymer transporter ExbD [Deltaproteobacteria bacterium]
MAASGSGDEEDIISGINVTPLVDIVLVILIIFMVTASLVMRTNVPVELPKAMSAEQSAQGLINLAVTRDGKLYANGRPAELEDIPALVAEARRKAAESGAKVTAFISADVGTPYGRFATVLDRLRVEGVTDIALDTQPVEAPPPAEEGEEGE